MNRQGAVFYKDFYAGLISEIETGYRFVYDSAYLENKEARQLSCTLPLQSVPFESKTMFSFFDGLIPEGWLLSIVVHNWKIDARDRMELLLTVCHDCIGAVRVEALHG